MVGACGASASLSFGIRFSVCSEATYYSISSGFAISHQWLPATKCYMAFFEMKLKNYAKISGNTYSRSHFRCHFYFRCSIFLLPLLLSPTLPPILAPHMFYLLFFISHFTSHILPAHILLPNFQSGTFLRLKGDLHPRRKARQTKT